jgi:hypothetical protein
MRTGQTGVERLPVRRRHDKHTFGAGGGGVRSGLHRTHALTWWKSTPRHGVVLCSVLGNNMHSVARTALSGSASKENQGDRLQAVHVVAQYRT